AARTGLKWNSRSGPSRTASSCASRARRFSSLIGKGTITSTLAMDSPRSLFEKIWERHVILRREGQCLLYVDRHIIHDGSFHAFAKLASHGLAVRRPRQTFGTPDHYVPTVSRSPDDAPNAEVKRMVLTFATNVAAHGIPAFQLGDERQGIVHIVGPEQ